LLSAFRIAPAYKNIFGFDIVVSDRHLVFSMEKCLEMPVIIKANSCNFKK